MTSTFWLKALEMILALSLLVIVHEFGHYLFARLFGMWVEKYYIFFNPQFSLVRWDPKRRKVEFFVRNPADPNEKKKEKSSEVSAASAKTEPAQPADCAGPTPPQGRPTWRDTIYGIGWVPLGGYCSISGMIDESLNTEQMQQPAKPYEFRSKPAWQRLLVMVGGVLFNFLAAVVIYTGIVYAYGDATLRLTDVTEGMNYCDSAHQLGFQDGDIPLTADGRTLDCLTLENVQAMLGAKTVTVLRNHRDTVSIAIPDNYIFTANKEAENGQPFMNYRFPVVIYQTQARMGAEKAGLRKGDHMLAVGNDTTPSYNEFTAALAKHKNQTVSLRYLRDGKPMETQVEVDGNGKLGILLMKIDKVYNVQVSRYNLLQSIPRGISMGWTQTVTYVKSLKLLFSAEGAKSLGGFGAIGSIFPDEWNWLDFWSITAFLSIILAVMNILPIPALDGGHVLFLLWEIVTRRKPSDKFLEHAQYIGMALLFALLLFANGNDIYRFFFK
ncbi:MAG: RIP metalloprotease RseP [Muribaculaceae bacterium]|nr:RIP metalloprotease RseP [Muribaculaceae bacterium]